MPVMESVIFQDSPLAQYLEGQGELDQDWLPAEAPKTPPEHIDDFAPRRISIIPSRFTKLRKKASNVRKRESDLVTRLYNIYSVAINSKIGTSENTRFLEQFRYVIVASQLLSEHSSTAFYKPNKVATGANESIEQVGRVDFDVTGVAITTACALAVALLLKWARGDESGRWSSSRLMCVGLVFSTIAAFAYVRMRRQWLKQLRQQAVESASTMITQAQELDGASSSAITMVQEVELVSRGYRLSTPLPPVSRIEERSQTKRCIRLRRALRSCLGGLLDCHFNAYKTIRPLADETDLEKYCDIYEVTAGDLEQAKAGHIPLTEDEGDSLKLLKTLYMELYSLRKVVLCCLLAIGADGDADDLSRWTVAVKEMNELAAASEESVKKIGNILSEEDRFLPPSPINISLPPEKVRLRAQLRKLSGLSQGIRSLQAKMHVLREESDKTLDESTDVAELGSSLMNQYESIGNDLRNLMEDWERGKASLVQNIDRNSKRISSISSISLTPASPTFSLGGLTAVSEGPAGPAEALKKLNGEGDGHLSVSSSDDEVFEAVALPRKRSSMTREERIAKMKEERARQTMLRQSQSANTQMLRELQTVINLRPRPNGTNRVTSI